jgi:hypothetical protein
MTVADLFVVGDRVRVDCVDGFSVVARVIEVRNYPGNCCKVDPEDKSVPAFWAHDFELSPWPTVPGKDGYDSRPETIAHIAVVRENLEFAVKDLRRRQSEHDLSKLADPEKATFDEYTPKLKASTYGSPEYEAFRAAMGPALSHHYACNSHHPEHYPDGIRGMCLLDVLEMLADWKAATLRHADGNLRKSIEINQKRFGYTDELKRILLNTAERLGGCEQEPTDGTLGP